MAKKTMRHASALKAKRQNIVRKASNSQTRNRIRTLTKSVLKAVTEKNNTLAQSKFKEAQSAWQKAAKRNIFHKNTAGRQIAKMASRLAVLSKS